MPRTPNAACDVCDAAGYQFPGTTSAYRCRACRRQTHGTSTAYRRGCRCDVCRAAAVAMTRRSQERYRAKHGVLPSTAYRREHGYGPVYWVPAAVRLAVYERDAYVCQLCSEPTDPSAHHNDDRFPSLDHIVPQSRGGTHEPENLRTAHRVCNARRGASDA